jgi:hypothetical protein
MRRSPVEFCLSLHWARLPSKNPPASGRKTINQPARARAGAPEGGHAPRDQSKRRLRRKSRTTRRSSLQQFFERPSRAPRALGAPIVPNGRVGSPQRTQTSGAKRRSAGQRRPSRKSRTARRSIPTISFRKALPRQPQEGGTAVARLWNAKPIPSGPAVYDGGVETSPTRNPKVPCRACAARPWSSAFSTPLGSAAVGCAPASDPSKTPTGPRPQIPPAKENLRRSRSPFVKTRSFRSKKNPIAPESHLIFPRPELSAQNLEPSGFSAIRKTMGGGQDP